MRGWSQFDPVGDRLPLLAVALEAGRGDVPEREAVGGEVDVVLRVAQEAEQRHVDALQEGAQLVGRDRALARAHADDRRSAPWRCAGARAARRRTSCVAWMSKMLGCSGISTLSASFITSSRRLPCRPAGRVEDDVRRALGRPDDVVAAHLPGRDRRQPGRAQARARCCDDCWRSTSPSITALAARGEVAGEVGRQRRLAHAALRVGDHDHRHATPPLLVLRVC